MSQVSGGSQELLDRRRALQQAIAELDDLRPGQLVARYRKCGKPNCHCAAPGDPGHGPCWSLTRVVEGKTVTRVIPAGPAVARTQAQLDEYRRFRKLSHELVEISEAICDASLRDPAATVREAKKKRSRKTSMSRSATKSPR